MTKLNIIKKTIDPKNILISERTLLTDRNVFAQQLYNDKCIDLINWQLYNIMCDTVLEDNIKPKGIIYLYCSPKNCFSRIKQRNRVEENNISFKYLSDIHQRHEDWLSSTNIPVLKIDVNENYLDDMKKVKKIIKDIESFIDSI